CMTWSRDSSAVCVSSTSGCARRAGAAAEPGDAKMICAAEMRAVVLSISTSRASGEAEDTSGPQLAQLAQAMGADVASVELLPDDRELTEQRLRHWADVERCELILTTGGTGFAPSDVTPEANRGVIEPPAPRM